MLEISFNIYQTTMLASLVLVAGIFIASKVKVLRKYCVPAAVVGGLLFSIINLILYTTGTCEIKFEETMKNIFMMVFFCSVGFMASFKLLKAGGVLLIKLLVALAVLIVIQNIVGIVLSVAFGLNPMMGLALGSIPLVGGHGTAASFGVVLTEQYGVTGADVVSVAAATFGLVFSGLIGGPLATRLVRRYSLKSEGEETDTVDKLSRTETSENKSFLYALLLLIIGIGLGTYLTQLINSTGFTVPVYIGAMLVALIIRNAADLKGYKIPMREISILGWISLAVFLAMALMVMKLWQIADLAVPMVTILLVQVAVVALFSYFIIFRVCGKNYESAAFVTAVCGFGLGATPNAVANMESLTEKYGPAPVAFFIVPLLGSVFIDLVNATILAIFINIL